MASLDDIKQSFDAFRSAWQAEGRTGQPRLITSFWYGIEKNGKEQMVRHLDRYLNFMAEDVAKQLAPVAGFNGSINDLKEFLAEIKRLGADDVILVPTSADLAEINTIAKAIY